MFESTIFTNEESNQIEKIIFDFGNEITLVADAASKSVCRYHGGILVKENFNCTDLTSINAILKNTSEEISKEYGGNQWCWHQTKKIVCML